jgi:hypothetical protein
MAQSFSKWSVVFSLLLILSGFTFRDAKRHPFFISVTEINHNASNGSIEISCKMFTDDLENTLKKEFKTPLDLAAPKDKRQLDKFVFEYLRQHLQLKVNGKTATFNFVGFETEGESAWSYLEVKNVSQVKSIDISNSLLYESYDSQISIIHAMVGGTRKSTKLVNPEKNAAFTF